MKKIISQNLSLGLAIAVISSSTMSLGSDGVPPIADAGLRRYAAQDPVVLDGTGSYDPDNSGPLTFMWTQSSGAPLVVADANTANPTISGFVQTEEIQECEFELVVSDGELTSLPETVRVVIVPDFGENMLRLTNDSFDPNKPTYVFFQGGSGGRGLPYPIVPSPFSADWLRITNTINFHEGYMFDIGISYPRTYYDCGDMIIVYLSSVAPDYKMPIQTAGVSLGGQPAVDVGIRLNTTYQDARYAVNRVTFLDASTQSRGYEKYSNSVAAFLASSVDGEQCWLDNYVSKFADFYPNVLNVGFTQVDHLLAVDWFGNSQTNPDLSKFNNGIIAGVYWSVVGPGKNLQLASTPDVETYKFKWYGNQDGGYMDFYDESDHPGRLPEPVTLLGPAVSAIIDDGGAVLSCEESENAVGYQLLFGPDPYRVMDYAIISDTPTPPYEIITTLPFDETWWTVRVRDQYGSTIYADPRRIDDFILSLPVENVSAGKRYGYVQDAIDQAASMDEIVLSEGTYYENIDFGGKDLTLMSRDPDDPNSVSATIINGGQQGSVITLSGPRGGACVLAGLTIVGGRVGVSCCDASPTIHRCTIESNGPNAIEFWEGCELPTIVDCIILGAIVEVPDPTLIAHWTLDETEGIIVHDAVGQHHGKLLGNPQWRPLQGQTGGALELDGKGDFISAPFVVNPADGVFSVFAWIKGGAPGQVVLSQGNGTSWLCMDSATGNLMTELKQSGRYGGALLSQTVIADGHWHRVGFVWDEADRILYVDDTEVARDAQTGLEGSRGSLYIGVGNTFGSSSFFSGLIDDVRIYNRPVSP
jgi:hypothetical protein